jgi:hypothetical protein
MMPPRVHRLLLWVVLPALVLVLLYAGFGFLMVPRLIRSNAQSFVSEHYHRQLALGDIRFNPFSLRLDIRDLALPDADGQPMLAFRHLLVDLTVASIWRRGPSFQTILLEQPFARTVIRPDGTLNFSDLALPPSPQAKPEPNPKPVRLFINRFSVLGGNVAFEDHAHPSAFRAEIKPIAFDLTNFSTVSKEGGNYELTASSDAGERFSWSGSLSSYPLASHGRFEVASLRAQTLWSYMRDSVYFELPSGVISLNGDYDFTTATAPLGLSVNVHDVTVTDLAMRPKGGTEDYIKLVRVEVHDTKADVGKRTASVGNVHVAGGEIRAWVQPPAAAVNLLELAGPQTAGKPASPQSNATAAPPPEPATPPSQPATAGNAAAPATPSPPAQPSAADTPWSISAPDIEIESFKVSAEDRQVKPIVALQLDDLHIHVTGFASPQTSPLAVAVTSQVNHDGRLDVKADLSPDFAAMKVQAQLDKIDLTVLQPYIAQRTAMTLRSGLLSTKLNVDRGADNSLAATGELELAKLRTVDNALKLDFIKVERLQILGLDYQAKPSKRAALKVHSIVARGPYARVIIEADRSVNISKILTTPGAHPPAPAGPSPAHASKPAAAKVAKSAAKPAPAAPSDNAMNISVAAIRVQDGSANYADFWIQPNFAVGIQTLNGSILGLASNPKARAKVELKGKVDRYAPVRIWGEINPLAATAFSEINMSFKGVELTSVTPYSGHFAGYKIEKGKLSVDIGYKIHDRQLEASHRFVIDQLQLGERVESPDAIKLPLKIAIALLKDRNGVIDVDLPVTGSLDDPQFRLGPLIWKAVLNLLTKIATAPFAMLGHLFGGGEQMNFIDFRPGHAELDPSEQEKLSSLVKALKEKTQLELDVPVTYSADLDRAGLASQQLQNRLRAIHEEESGGGKHGKKAAAAPAAGDDSLLTDPAQRFHLLVKAHHDSQGKDAALPDAALAVEAAEKKKAQPDFGAANSELEASMLQKINVPDGDLEALGKKRAQVIQDALLGGGEIDPSRVFVIGSDQKGPTVDKDKVRVELALK